MKTNPYLKAIGVNNKSTHCNFPYNIPEFFKCIPGRAKRFKERFIYGFDSSETWDYDYIFIEQLYSHIKMFIEKATPIIDFENEYVKYNWKGKEINQLEAMNIICDCCEKFLTIDNELENIDFQNIDKIPQSLKDISPEQKKAFDKFNKIEQERIEDMQEAIKLFADIWRGMWW